MATNTGHVMTLANSIIGVSVLAMPFCFKQCGITLAILLLVLSSITSRLACHFLVKSSSMCKRRNFEFLAFYTFGPSGKLLVELGIIGFMMGTCVAFFVVIGDLGPEIISKIFNVKNDNTLRSIVLLGLGLCVVLPLGLLRNIDSLAAISTITMGFYFLLVVKIFLESFSHLLAGDWIQKVNFWQPEGVLRCIPIFAMALSCQTQIFEIYETLPVPTLDKMNSVVRSAINMCTIVYISVGLLGYIAYCTGNFGGNILLSFAPSLASEMYKLGFVMSIAVSFPLVIFPCRASLHSLIFRRMPVHHELSQTSSHIPDMRFKCLTTAIVFVSMITGLLIPSIELVLGFVGSTIGVAICVIFPALSFINLTNKETNERITAKVTLLLGFIIMITGSLANFQAATEVKSTEGSLIKIPDIKIFPDFKPPRKIAISTESIPLLDKQLPDKSSSLKKNAAEKSIAEQKPRVVAKPKVDQKKEPPNPVAPGLDVQPSQKPIILPPAPVIEIKKSNVEKEANEVKPPNMKSENRPQEIKIREENINRDAIEKEEREIHETEQLKKKNKEQKQQELLEKLKEYQDEQKKVLQEQLKILIEIKSREMEKNQIQVKEDKDKAPLKQNEESIKQDDFSKNIKKIQNVIDTLKDTQVAIREIKKNEKEQIIEKQNEGNKNDQPREEKNIEPIKPSSPLTEIKESKDDVKKSKVNSVPLPLAKLQSNVENGGQEKSEGAVQSKQDVMRRDILEDSKKTKTLIRERRDVEETKTNVAGQSMQPAKVDECHIEEKQNIVLKNLNVVMLNKTDTVSHQRDKEGNDTESVTIIEEVTVIPKNLIRNSEHISLSIQLNTELKLDKKDSKIMAADSGLSFPKKRDLKSFKTNERSSQSIG